MSRYALLRLGLAVLAGGLFPLQALADSDPFDFTPNYFNFFWSPPPTPPPVRPVSQYQVREILQREGARMIGAPRVRGFEIIAIGRERSGVERRFTLDAETGEVLAVAVAREAPDPRRPAIDLNAPLDRALGAPVHPAGSLDADHLGMPPPPMPPEQVVPPPPPRQAEAPPPPPDTEPLEAPAPDPDAALSPVKPLRRAPGAPRVEKLPQ
jgi:hypothetical protein